MPLGRWWGTPTTSSGSEHAFLYSNGTIADLNFAGFLGMDTYGGRCHQRLRADRWRRHQPSRPTPCVFVDADDARRCERGWPGGHQRFDHRAGQLRQTGMTWTQGEFTGDGTVDINDLTIVLANFGKTAGSSLAAASPNPPLSSFSAAAPSPCSFTFGGGRHLPVSFSPYSPHPLSGVVVAVDCVPQGRAG